MIPEVIRVRPEALECGIFFGSGTFLGPSRIFFPQNLMLSELSLIFYAEFLRGNLHKINNTDHQVIRAISDVPEKNTMYGLVIFFLLFFKLNSVQVQREKKTHQLPIHSLIF